MPPLTGADGEAAVRDRKDRKVVKHPKTFPDEAFWGPRTPWLLDDEPQDSPEVRMMDTIGRLVLVLAVILGSATLVSQFVLWLLRQ